MCNWGEKINIPTLDHLGVDSDSKDCTVHALARNVFLSPEQIPSKRKITQITSVNSQHHNGHIFWPNEEILENGVVDFMDYNVLDNDQ